MTMYPAVCTILHGGGDAPIRGTPCGRQFADGSSFECDSSSRSAARALAHGWNGTSSGLRSAAIFWLYLLPLGSQIPDKSGCPSAKRGAGAERFGLPSAPRGIEGAGTFTRVCVAFTRRASVPCPDELSGDPLHYRMTCLGHLLSGHPRSRTKRV